jgi:hypothetical protein
MVDVTFDVAGQRVFAEDAGQQAGRGEPGLGGGNEARRRRLDLQRPRRAALAGVGKLLQPRPARRGERHFGQREEAAGEDQKSQNAEGAHVMPWILKGGCVD